MNNVLFLNGVCFIPFLLPFFVLSIVIIFALIGTFICGVIFLIVAIVVNSKIKKYEIEKQEKNKTMRIIQAILVILGVLMTLIPMIIFLYFKFTSVHTSNIENQQMETTIYYEYYNGQE